jgi:hypothetical protein
MDCALADVEPPLGKRSWPALKSYLDMPQFYADTQTSHPNAVSMLKIASFGCLAGTLRLRKRKVNPNSGKLCA